MKTACLWKFIITAELNHFYRAFIWKVLYTNFEYGREHFPCSLGLISFLETATKIPLACSRVLYLRSVLVLRPVTNTRLLTFITMQAEPPHILPCCLVLPSQPARCAPGSLRSSRLGRFPLCGHPGPELEKRIWTSHVSCTSAVTATVWQSHLKMMIHALMLFLPYYNDQSHTFLPAHRQVLLISARVWGPAETWGPPPSRVTQLLRSPSPPTKNLSLTNTGCCFFKKV